MQEITCRFTGSVGSDVKFCTGCGSPELRRWVVTNDARERFVCASCSSVHYQNPRVIVACAVFCANNLLMCQRAHEPERGTWVIPSGFLECGETLQEGAARETFEETGVVLDSACMHLHATIDLVHIGQIYVVFRNEIQIEPIVQPGIECLEVAFVSETSVSSVNLAWPEITAPLIKNCFALHRLGGIDGSYASSECLLY
jgi:ADP-ribose pyrophosphatase YjhB (NUDIX family)